MKLAYDWLAGRSVERLAALSDGIFGVAMTLLLLEVHLPGREQVSSEHDLILQLLALAPTLLIYLLSFVTLGLFWVGQQTQLNHLRRSDRHLTWIHLAFLFCVTLLPLTTRLLVAFDTYRTAVIVYWFNSLLLGALLYASWGRSVRAKLLDDNVTYEIQAAVCHRIIIAQSFYAFGAALCFINTYLSIGFIVLVQLNYAFSPSTWRILPAPADIEEKPE